MGVGSVHMTVIQVEEGFSGENDTELGEEGSGV